jgi:hypothetical protein
MHRCRRTRGAMWTRAVAVTALLLVLVAVEGPAFAQVAAAPRDPALSERQAQDQKNTNNLLGTLACSGGFFLLMMLLASWHPKEILKFFGAALVVGLAVWALSTGLSSCSGPNTQDYNLYESDGEPQR